MGIKDIANLAPKPETPAPRARAYTFGLKIPGTSPNGSNGSRLDVPKYLAAHGIEYRTKDIDGGAVAYLVPCPFDHFPNHSATKTKVRERVGQSRAFDQAWLLIVNSREVEECKVKASNGQEYDGWRRVYPDERTK